LAHISIKHDLCATFKIIKIIKIPLNQKLWLDSLDAVIPGGISVADYTVVLNADHNTARGMMHELAQNGIGKFDGVTIEFEDGDKLRATILALQKGVPIDEIAKHLDWRDFEGLTTKILEFMEFVTTRNLILTNPRMEIDVVGVKFGVAMLIDCKHWKRHSQSALKEAVRKQIERTKQYVAKTSGAIAVPVIVTLYQDKVSFIDKVPIVPIFQFASFVDEFYGNLESVQTIGTEKQ
jgi:DNA-binding transcriptional MerR regulator